MIPCNDKIIKCFCYRKAFGETVRCIWVNMHVSLTAANLGADSLGEGDALRQLVSEALSHVVIDVIGAQQLFKGLGGVSQVLSQNMAHATALPHPLTQVRQLTGLRLDQRVKLTAWRMVRVLLRVKIHGVKFLCHQLI